jgi:hypothetical protein
VVLGKCHNTKGKGSNIGTLLAHMAKTWMEAQDLDGSRIMLSGKPNYLSVNHETLTKHVPVLFLMKNEHSRVFTIMNTLMHTYEDI